MSVTTVRWLVLFSLAANSLDPVAAQIVAAGPRPSQAESLTFDARSLFAGSTTRDLRLAHDASEITLERGILVEDDGPAAGFSYKPNEERLGGSVRIKKELVVPHPRAKTATLLVAPGGDLRAVINGKQCDLEPLGKTGNYWQAYRFSPGLLKRGKNEIVLDGSGKVWIARDDEFPAGSPDGAGHPNRSAKSADGGKTWDDDRLGTGNDLDGEYCVRVFLDQYCPRGVLTSPVIDLGNLKGRPVGPPVSEVGPVRLIAKVDAGDAARVRLRARTGGSFVPDTTWSDWTALDSTGGTLKPPSGRYLQIEIELTTTDPLISPSLKELVVSASPRRPRDWTMDLKLVEQQNEPVVRSSVPFRYEPFDHPKLKALRETYHLDRIVEGAKTELELIERLAAWSATRWTGIRHLGKAYPPWDALEILKEHADGTPVGGFCQQYNVVFLQACESFGLVGRAVSLGPGTMTDTFRSGHEVVEIWSNQFKKWVYIDGNHAWYLVDSDSGTLLSLLELRDRQLAALGDKPHRPVRLVRITDTRKEWNGLESGPPFVELRLIPRSNFLEEPHPVPLNQGMRGWFWTGHHVWTDDLAPARPIYSNRVGRRENFEWTLNHAHIVLEATPRPGELRVHLDTHTPGFETFIAAIDDGPPKPVETGFLWKLHKGRNKLRIVPRNGAQREGTASRIVLDFQ